MRTLIAAAAFAGVFSTTLTVEARNICRHDGTRWVDCAAHGTPSVPPDRHVGIAAPQKDARPADGCTLLHTAAGTQRWSCPPGTAARLRNGTPGIRVLSK